MTKKIVKPRWVTYRDMEGPRHLGRRDPGGAFIYEYSPPKPWGVWSQILGVVAACEGRHDTVVMYDGTGVTFGAFQWTFTSGRLQRLLEYFKSVPIVDFERDVNTTLFDWVCVHPDGCQVFEEFGFKILGGEFIESLLDSRGNMTERKLLPQRKADKRDIVDICMGKYSQHPKRSALQLCSLFAKLGQILEVQLAMVEYAKIEFKRSLDYRRPPLKEIGGTIRCLLPDEVWGTPIPAIFFNLFQNSPGEGFKFFKSAMSIAEKKGIVGLDSNGYSDVVDTDVLLDIIWSKLCLSRYADWGFGSKQYIASGGKNPPRVKNIRPALVKYYDVRLPYIGEL